jgi:hypothetical protein
LGDVRLHASSLTTRALAHYWSGEQIKDGYFGVSERTTEACPYELIYLFHDISLMGLLLELPSKSVFLPIRLKRQF